MIAAYKWKYHSSSIIEGICYQKKKLCSYKRCRGSYPTVKLRPFSVESHFDIKYLVISFMKTVSLVGNVCPYI